MKSFIKLILVLALIGCSGKSPYPWFKGSLAEAQEIAGSKLIFVDFYTDS